MKVCLDLINFGKMEFIFLASQRSKHRTYYILPISWIQPNEFEEKKYRAFSPKLDSRMAKASFFFIKKFLNWHESVSVRISILVDKWR